MRTLFYALLCLCFGSVAYASEIRCDFTAKFACTSEGCLDNPITIWNLVDFDASRYSRCDKKGCDRYYMHVTRAGAYITIDIPGHGTLAKMSRDGSQYVEIATLGTNVLVSYGSCK